VSSQLLALPHAPARDLPRRSSFELVEVLPGGNGLRRRGDLRPPLPIGCRSDTVCSQCRSSLRP